MVDDGKCPQCGAARETDATVCPDCGFAFTLTYTDERGHESGAEKPADERQQRAENARLRAQEMARQILNKARAEEEADETLAAERRRRIEAERQRELAAARPKRDAVEPGRALEDGIKEIEAAAEEILGPHALAAGRAADERERKLEAIIRREQKAAQETLAEAAATNAANAANAAAGVNGDAPDAPQKPSAAELPDLMRCPFCKEMVLSNAGTCPGCGEPVVPGLLMPGMMRSESRQRGRGCMLFFLFCLGLFAVLGFFALRMAMRPVPPKATFHDPAGIQRMTALRQCFNDDGSNRIVTANMTLASWTA